MKKVKLNFFLLFYFYFLHLFQNKPPEQFHSGFNFQMHCFVALFNRDTKKYYTILKANNFGFMTDKGKMGLHCL